MGRCDVCNNEYDKPLEIRQKGRTGTFDSFECAIQAMAPTCGDAGSSATGWRPKRRYSAAPTVHVPRGSLSFGHSR